MKAYFNNLLSVFLGRHNPNHQQDIMAKLIELIAAVAALTTINDSAVRLISGISEQLRDAKDDPEAIAALITELNHSKAAIATAISQNADLVPPLEPAAPVIPSDAPTQPVPEIVETKVEEVPNAVAADSTDVAGETLPPEETAPPENVPLDPFEE